MNKEEIIIVINKIDNILKYSIKGGTSMFNKDYPNLLNEIKINTKEIELYKSNQKLVARLLYLKKYNGEIKNISHDNKIMIYDYKINDFKIANINVAQKQWDEIKYELADIDEHYSKEDTIELLKYNYLEYFGKLGNRKLLKNNNKLFYSLYYHTSNLDSLNKNLNKFTMRLYILVNNINIRCNKHNCVKFWRFKNKEFNIVCGKCEPKYPSIDWFKNKYNDDWNIELNKRRIKLKKLKTNSLMWHIKRYNEVEGKIKYDKFVYNRIVNLTKLKRNKFSKISQDLFWKIYKILDNTSNVFFHELNQEFVIRIPKKFKYNKSVMIVDFIQNNKIIEYNGEYWHNETNDKIRKHILNKMGYQVLYISSNEYNRNNKNKSIINKCLKFLQC